MKFPPPLFLKMMLKWVLLITSIYLCIVFLIPFLIFPGFFRAKEVKVSEKTKRIAKKLMSKNKEQTLRNVFDYTKNLYTEQKYKFISEPHKHFYSDIDEIVDKKQFLPCHVQNRVFIALLLGTGQFKKEDFRRKITLGRRFLNVHGYCLVKVENKFFRADPFKGKLMETKKF